MRTFFAAALLFSSLALAGCGAVDAAIDCQSICSRYSSCWDANYDIQGCEERCRSHASSDTEYRQRADSCNACISGRACPSATFNCGTECSSVVP